MEIPVQIAEAEPIAIVEQEVQQQVVQPTAVRNDRNSIHYYTSKEFDTLEMFKDLVDEKLSEVGNYIDIAGKSHTTLISCLKQNQLYIDLAYGHAVVDITTKLVEDKK